MNKRRGMKLKQKNNNHKEWVTGWKYKMDAPYDKEWQEDRKKLFAKSGNGWWRYLGTPQYREHIQRIKDEMS